VPRVREPSRLPAPAPWQGLPLQVLREEAEVLVFLLEVAVAALVALCG